MCVAILVVKPKRYKGWFSLCYNRQQQLILVHPLLFPIALPLSEHIDLFHGVINAFYVNYLVKKKWISGDNVSITFRAAFKHYPRKDSSVYLLLFAL